MGIFKNLYSIIVSPFGKDDKSPDNAIIERRSKRWSGEISTELPLFRFYEYYHGWPEVKEGINSIARRWMGVRREVRSEDETFTMMLKMWIEITNFYPKLSQFALDTLISGSGIMEQQYDGKNLANVAHIPTKTLFKIFRDKHGNVLEYVQLLDGEAIVLAPKWIMQYNINNPEEESLGKSEIFSIATPQKISGERDELGQPINPDRFLPSVLDSKARLKFAHMETLEKHARSQIFVTIDGETDRPRQEQIEKQLNDKSSDKWLHVTDKEVKTAEASVNPQAPFKEYSEEMERSVNQATGFPGKVINESGSMGFASSQTPIQEMSQRIANMQTDLAELVQDTIFQQLAKQWGFDYLKVKPKLLMIPFKESLTFDQVMQLEPSSRISDKEFRDILRHHIDDLNDKEFEEFQTIKQENQDNMMKKKAEMSEMDKVNPRPDIEDDAERPPQTNSLENHPLLKNPKALEHYIRAVAKEIISKERSDHGGFFFATDATEPFESDPPVITDPRILERLEELRTKLVRAKEKVDKAGFAGFNTLQKCIDANRGTEDDPRGYCLMQFGKAEEELDEIQSDVNDFLNAVKKGDDLNDLMFRMDAKHVPLNEDSASMKKSNETNVEGPNLSPQPLPNQKKKKKKTTSKTKTYEGKQSKKQ